MAGESGIVFTLNTEKEEGRHFLYVRNEATRIKGHRQSEIVEKEISRRLFNNVSKCTILPNSDNAPRILLSTRNFPSNTHRRGCPYTKKEKKDGFRPTENSTKANSLYPNGLIQLKKRLAIYEGLERYF